MWRSWSGAAQQSGSAENKNTEGGGMKTRHSCVIALACVCLFASEAGAQWTLQSIPYTGSLTDCIMLDTMTAFAVGRGREILRTKDGGASWINLAAPLSSVERWNGVSFFDTANGIAVGDNGVAMTTTNGGNSWTWHRLQGARTAYSALHIGPGNIFVGADSGWIYHSIDSGATWSAEKVSQWPIRSLFVWSGAYIFDLGLPVFALTPYSIVAKTEFPSIPWHEAILPPFRGLGSEAFDGAFALGGGPAFVVGVQGDLRAAPAVIRADLADTMWKNVTYGIHDDGTLFGVSVPSAHTVYVCGAHGMLYKSSDTGNTWSAQAVPTTKNLYAISFVDEKHGIAVGDTGTILRTANGGVTLAGRDERAVPSNFFLEQNVPNPFNPSTRIGYSVGRRMHVTIEIVDITGKKICVLADGEHAPGKYSIDWNGRTSSGAEAASGAYFCRMRAGAGQSVIKLLLAR
jgi:photosystem II stability/assembly factor-like uncharacterized protein